MGYRDEDGCPVIRCYDFLRSPDNKQVRMGSTMAVVSNVHNSVHNSVHQSASASTLQPSVKHKAYLIEMVTNGITKIGIRTVDTDVLVLALGSFNKLDAI